MKKTPDTCKRSAFREKPRLVVTIDTEEDDWDGPYAFRRDTGQHRENRALAGHV